MKRQWIKTQLQSYATSAEKGCDSEDQKPVTAGQGSTLRPFGN